MNAPTFEPYRGVQRSAKIGSRHLELLAIVFVRQSSPGQVLHHQESARLQYSLKERAISLGWAGGHETKTEVRRPVAKTSQLSYYPELLARVEVLRAKNLTYRQAARILNEEGWKSASFRGKFHEATLSELFSRTPAARANGDKFIKEELGPNEWTVPGLADELGIPKVTIHCWIKKGVVRARKVATGYTYGSWVVSADAAELKHLRALQRRRRGLRWPRKTPDGAAP